MKKNPLISVIVPVYQVEKYLPKCLDSILSQTFEDFELLLIDDGSNDQSGKICDEYALKDGRIRVFHKTNGGVSSARNLGIENAKGLWITFVDSDDYLDTDYLNVLDIIPDNVDLILTDYICLGAEIKNTYHNDRFVLQKSNYNRSLMYYYHKGFFLSPWAKFFRTDIIRTYHLEFDINIKWAEDRLFVLDFISHSKAMLFSGGNKYIYIMPDSQQNIMKYHVSIPMIIELRDKLKIIANRLSVSGIYEIYESLWVFVEKVALLDSNSKEIERLQFYSGYKSIKTLLHMISFRNPLRFFVYFYSSHFSDSLQKRIIKKYLNL